MQILTKCTVKGLRCTYKIEAPIDRIGCVVSACDKFIVKMKVVAGIHNLEFRMTFV
jgi:hypothetical protein